MADNITPSRQAAFWALNSCEKQGAWIDQAIRAQAKKLKLKVQDNGLAAAISYGVIQNQILLDWVIEQYSNVKVNKMDLTVKIALRMGVYQIAFLDRIPDNAAVNTSVSLVKQYSQNTKLANFTNAVLRSYLRGRDKLDYPADLSIRYSHPASLVSLFTDELKDNSVADLLKINNLPVDTTIQVNTLKTDVKTLSAEFERCGANVAVHPWMDDCITVSNIGNMEEMPAFRKGWFYVQDCAAKLAVLISGAAGGEAVLDACAAPGGKSFAAAICMKNSGTIISRDVHKNKLKRIQDGAERLGICTIETAAQDARKFEPQFLNFYDIVLADVPCSGLGIIRKKPDIRYKNLDEIVKLPAIQKEILNNLSRYVKKGGVLVYSTCTVLQRENENIVEAFLLQHPEFSLEAFHYKDNIHADAGMITLWPHKHGTDGFFIAKLRRADE